MAALPVGSAFPGPADLSRTTDDHLGRRVHDRRHDAHRARARRARREPRRFDGTPGQRFSLENRPVLTWPGSSLTVVTGEDTSEWQAVEHFASADGTTACFHIDSVAGELVFGPGVRERDGTIRQYGAIPPKGALLQMSAYRTGGGTKGNVSIGQIRVLKTSVPYVSRVENRRAAVGGAEAKPSRRSNCAAR